MLETYQSLLLQLDTRSIRETAACIGFIQSPGKLSEQQQEQLWDALQAYNKQCSMPFLVYRQENWCELTTNISVLKDLTQQYTVSPMAEFLSKTPALSRLHWMGLFQQRYGGAPEWTPGLETSGTIGNNGNLYCDR